MSTGIRQYHLDFEVDDGHDFEHFVPGADTATVAILRRLAGGDERRPVYLWGATGTGKSHLLHACCRLAARQGRHVLRLIPGDAAACNEARAHADLVCIDELERIAGRRARELELLGIYEGLRARGATLLTAARAPLGALPLVLEDVRSRLGWGLVFRLGGLDDAGKLHALRLRAALRCLELGDEAAGYLLNRMPRDTHSLFTLLDRLDRNALSAQRRLTIPFIRTALKLPSPPEQGG